MKFIWKTIMFATVCLVFSQYISAQLQPNLGGGVEKHKGIDRIYSEFSGAYATLNPAKVAGLYGTDATYLPPGRTVVKGRTAILDNFGGFFSNVKERGQTMTISFSIETRHFTKDLGYDIGTYEIVFSKEGKEIGRSKGRFVVVTKKNKDGIWRFDVDSYHSLDEEDG